jgi:hypothetical protein
VAPRPLQESSRRRSVTETIRPTATIEVRKMRANCLPVCCLPVACGRRAEGSIAAAAAAPGGRRWHDGLRGCEASDLEAQLGARRRCPKCVCAYGSLARNPLAQSPRAAATSCALRPPPAALRSGHMTTTGSATLRRRKKLEGARRGWGGGGVGGAVSPMEGATVEGRRNDAAARDMSCARCTSVFFGLAAAVWSVAKAAFSCGCGWVGLFPALHTG